MLQGGLLYERSEQKKFLALIIFTGAWSIYLQLKKLIRNIVSIILSDILVLFMNVLHVSWCGHFDLDERCQILKSIVVENRFYGMFSFHLLH